MQRGLRHPESEHAGIADPAEEFCARSVLRHETRDLHVRAEALIGDRPFRDLPSYLRVLRANLSVIEAVHRAATAYLPPSLTAGLATDVARLRADLAELGAGADCDRLDIDIRTPAAALGAVYVMEGSRLGGRILARRAETGLGLGATSGATNLNGSGKATGRRWRRFVQALNLRVASAEDVSRAVTAARETFGLIIRQYERA